MSISDSIAIMFKGRIAQVDSPRDLYFRPKAQAVSEFIGQGTFLKGKVTSQDAEGYRVTAGGLDLVAVPADPSASYYPGEQVLLTIRPESFRIGGDGDNRLICHVSQISFLGKSQRILATFGDDSVTVEADPTERVSPGEEVVISVDRSKTLMIRA